MTSRLAYYGQSYEMGIEPDLMILGKWVGGGMTFGAFGGREDLMSQFDQNNGSLAHSGTFNNNVFSMTAGLAGLKVASADRIKEMNALGNDMRLRLQEILSRYGIHDLNTTTTTSTIQRSDPMYVCGLGSMLAVHFSGQYAPLLKGLFFHHLLSHRIYIASRGFISLSIEIMPDHVQKFTEAFEKFVASHIWILAQTDFHDVNSLL